MTPLRMILVLYLRDCIEHSNQNRINQRQRGNGDIFVVYHISLYSNSAFAVYSLVSLYLRSTSSIFLAASEYAVKIDSRIKKRKILS